MSEKPIKKWLGRAPEQCDICRGPLEDHWVDGATTMGPWANMCLGCHRRYGRGLGTGMGQKYDVNTLEKVEG